MGNPHLVHQASELWMWEDPMGNSNTGSAGRPRKLADISGVVESLEWGPSRENARIDRDTLVVVTENQAATRWSSTGAGSICCHPASSRGPRRCFDGIFQG